MFFIYILYFYIHLLFAIIFIYYICMYIQNVPFKLIQIREGHPSYVLFIYIYFAFKKNNVSGKIFLINIFVVPLD